MSTTNYNQQIAVVTGSSSGIGFETSLALARKGFRTYATMRNLSKRDTLQSLADRESLRISIVQLDVTNENSIKKQLSP